MTHDLAAVIAILAILSFTALAAYGFGFVRGHECGLDDGQRAVARWANGGRG